MAYAREIILMILTHIRFRMVKNRERDSFYTILGKTLVRISNHCTYMNTWDNFLKNNPKLKGLPIISIVFEDNGSTETNDSLVLSQNRRKPIVVNEYVFSCNGDGQFITEKDIKTIISDLRNISTTNTYTDNTFKSKYFKRVFNY